MALDSDLRQAYYISPSGNKFEFNYDSKLSRETDLKTATFTFPERDGALVVPLGTGGRRYSLTILFFGPDQLKNAAMFEEALKERGYGELRHPLYGVVKVVPVGTITLSDDVVAGIGVTTLSVTFAETITDTTNVHSEVEQKDEINKKLDSFEDEAALEFAEDLEITSIKNNIKTSNSLKDVMGIVTNALNKVAAAEKEVFSKIQKLEAELSSSVDNLVNSVKNIAIQTIKIMRLPSQMKANVFGMIEAYSEVTKNIISKFKNELPGLVSARNQWVIARLMLESATVCCASCVASQDKGVFKSRAETINAAVSILSIYDSIVEFEEKKIKNNYVLETGKGFNAMRDIVILSVAQIIQNSFSLPTKKVIILGRDRQIIELVYELYGNLDKLDEFIIDNNINYNELEVIPMGREVFCYV